MRRKKIISMLKKTFSSVQGRRCRFSASVGDLFLCSPYIIFHLWETYTFLMAVYTFELFRHFWHWWSLVDEFYYTFFSSSPCNRERWTRAEKVNWFRETTWKIYGVLKVLIFFSMFLTHSTPFFSFLKVKDHVAVKCKMITRRKIYNFFK